MSLLCVNNDIARGRNDGKMCVIVDIKNLDNFFKMSFLDPKINNKVKNDPLKNTNYQQ